MIVIAVIVLGISLVFQKGFEYSFFRYEIIWILILKTCVGLSKSNERIAGVTFTNFDFLNFFSFAFVYFLLSLVHTLPICFRHAKISLLVSILIRN